MTGTELIIEVASRSQDAEPEAVMVVYTDEAGNVCMVANCANTQTIGLAEYAKRQALRNVFGDEDE